MFTRSLNERFRPVIIVTLAVVLLTASGCASTLESQGIVEPAAVEAAAFPLEISVEEAYQLVEDGAFLLDVRTQEEWDEYHAPQAVLIPLDVLGARLNEVPRDQTVVLICRSGNRSAAGRDLLLNAGFSMVTSSSGGMNAWAAAGYPIESSAP
ncbi:MAG: rhodanese-like domain-containing protein [Anaerolineales bacterium]|nr:rhodanese-like domain-containing protein [Anaerolineales bacterium]